MKCSCGKECGIRLMCEECTQKLTQEFVDIQVQLKKATEKFDKNISKLQIRRELNLDGYRFTEIVNKYHFLASQKKTTKKEVFEWEFYKILKNLLDLLKEIEIGRKKINLSHPEFRENLEDLLYCFNQLEGIIKYLEGD